MSNYSNQNRQLYVVENANQVTVKAAPDGRKFIEYAKVGDAVSAGALLRSPLIDPKTVTFAQASTGAYFDRAIAKYEVTVGAHGKITEEGVDYVIPGQDYLLRLRIKQFVSMSDHDEYWKDGAVRGMAGMTVSAFYKAMAVSLAKSMARDLSPMVNVYLKSEDTTDHSADADVPVMVDGKFTAPADPAVDHAFIGIIVTEISAAAQLEDHNPGLMPIRPAHIELYADTVIKDGEEAAWGTAAKVASTAFIGNGADWQDMEYVLQGEIGSYYGEFDDPKVKIRTLAQVKDTQKYDVIELHFYEAGSHMDAGKSEKNITIICKTSKVRGGSNADALDTPASTILGTTATANTLKGELGDIFAATRTAGNVIA